MACNVCGGTVDFCDNGSCLVDIEKSEFKCFGSSHFCSRGCWDSWLINEAEDELQEAKDDGK